MWENALTYHYHGVQKLETPANLRWDGFTARWDPVAHAAKYTVEVYHAGTQVATVTVTDPAFNLHQISDELTMGETYAFQVSAVPEDGSTTYEASGSSEPSAASEPYQARPTSLWIIS